MKNLVKKIECIDAKNKKLKVCAYARVSKDSESLERSLNNQISYFKSKIESNKNYEFVKIYFDNGISGTDIKKRKQFRNMLSDCKNGKIDIIYTKSITRFARNTVDLLNTIRYLKSINVEVIFEKENVSSFTMEGELMLSILASFAQAEAESLSTNIKWSKKKRMEQGVEQYRPTFGYDYINGNYVINKIEARVVKLIYKEFLKGTSYSDIAKMVMQIGVKTRKNHLFNYAQVKCILQNERYTGYSILQKSYVTNPLTHHKKRNDGELPKYIIKNNCPRLVSKKDFEMVQMKIKGNR